MFNNNDYIAVYIFNIELLLINNPMLKHNTDIMRYLKMIDNNFRNINNDNNTPDIYSAIINIINNIYNDNDFLSNKERKKLDYKIIFLTTGIYSSNKYNNNNIINYLNKLSNINSILLICSFNKDPIQYRHNNYYFISYNDYQYLLNYLNK